METSNRIVRLSNVRLSFPFLHAPRVRVDPQTGKELPPRYECALLFPPGSQAHKQVTAAIKAACEERWPNSWEEQLKRIKAKDSLCVRDGDLSKYDGYPGNRVLSVARKSKDGAPMILGQNGKPMDPTKVGATFYAGCYVVAEVEFYSYPNGPSYPAGVSCQLLGIQFARDGDAFARTTVASQDGWEDLTTGEDDAGTQDSEEDSLV